MNIFMEKVVAEQATGCSGAGDYHKYANAQGYEFVQVVDWTSSAGDWTFIVSKDQNEWFVMGQSNNYPRGGFTRTIDTSCPYYGTAEGVLEEIYAKYYRH